jgi:hypothetical protein
MTRDRAYFLLLNIGHFLDHLFMLVFATAAALRLNSEGSQNTMKPMNPRSSACICCTKTPIIRW